MTWLRFRFSVILTAWLVTPCHAFADKPSTPVESSNAALKTYVVLDAPTLKGAKKSRWRKICGTQGKMPVGFKKILTTGITAISEEVICLSSPKKLPKKISNAYVWTLKFADNTLEFVFQRREQKGSMLLSGYRMGLSDDPLKDLDSEETLQGISQMLVESSPTGWLTKGKGDEKGLLEFQFTEPKGSVKLTKYLYIYDLKFSEPTEKDADLKITPMIRARLVRSNKSTLGPNKETVITYVPDSVYLPIKKDTFYHTHTDLGPAMRQQEYDQKLKKLVKGGTLFGFVDDLIFGTLSSNYGGIRIGKSFIVDSLLSKAFLVSALIEVRGGPFQGLRWFYDIVPEVKAVDRGQDEEFRLARASLGWSFEIDMPQPIASYIKAIDFQPKIGLLDVKTKILPDATESADVVITEPMTFEAKNVLDLAGELGIEQQTDWLRARLWTSLSGAAFGVSNQDDVKVVSTKTGLDLYFDVLGDDMPFRSSLLAFGMYEGLSLSKDKSKVATSGGAAIAGIAFSTFFLGGGMTLSW